MKHLLRSLACTLLLASPWAGWAAVNCSLIPNPGTAKGIYSNFFGNVDIQGAFDVTCTRASTADRDIPLGINSGANSSDSFFRGPFTKLDQCLSGSSLVTVNTFDRPGTTVFWLVRGLRRSGRYQ